MTKILSAEDYWRQWIGYSVALDGELLRAMRQFATLHIQSILEKEDISPEKIKEYIKNIK